MTLSFVIIVMIVMNGRDYGNLPTRLRQSTKEITAISNSAYFAQKMRNMTNVTNDSVIYRMRGWDNRWCSVGRGTPYALRPSELSDNLR